MNKEIQFNLAAVVTKNQSHAMKSKTSYWVTTLAVSLGIAVRVQAVSTIQFTATSYTTNETAGAATLTVQRTGDTNTEVGVDYVTADGTATNGLKYTAVSGLRS